MHKDGSVDGTPQEIAEYQRIQTEKANSKPFKLDGEIRVAKRGCPNGDKPCYCTGACMGKDATGMEFLRYAYER